MAALLARKRRILEGYRPTEAVVYMFGPCVVCLCMCLPFCLFSKQSGVVDVIRRYHEKERDRQMKDFSLFFFSSFFLIPYAQQGQEAVGVCVCVGLGIGDVSVSATKSAATGYMHDEKDVDSPEREGDLCRRGK
ncbi:hypothetical protein QBC38DRAFT_449311 [Podospora fimiseda]|uniref:Uncharacterized protein n=1 Tax=Podospora fimiseda TaxID=252190 RepID=A0AAN6YM51_9PEZI|nr:hypothetical protein QBC38DRAFT_449311 [Podospora fimiseda]